jgi:putative transposase
MDFRRRLPHIRPPGRWLFLTWHLHGSLPQGLYPPPHKSNAGEAFVWMDRCLDQAQTGPLYLKLEDIAQLVVESLFRGADLGHYQVGAFVVMANHVHALLLPLVPVPRLMKSLKGATAREANLLLGRTGEPFWQSESYDHWVRDEAQYWRVFCYIEHNPVGAGLVERPGDYKWSSANEAWRSRCVHTSVDAAGKSAGATATTSSALPAGR